MSKGPIVAVVAAVTIPPVVQICLEVLYRWLEPNPLAIWLEVHGLAVAVAHTIAIGAVFLFRAFRPPVAAAIMVAYIPLMIALLFVVALGFVGFVYGDYL